MLLAPPLKPMLRLSPNIRWCASRRLVMSGGCIAARAGAAQRQAGAAYSTWGSSVFLVFSFCSRKKSRQDRRGGVGARRLILRHHPFSSAKQFLLFRPGALRGGSLRFSCGGFSRGRSRIARSIERNADLRYGEGASLRRVGHSRARSFDLAAYCFRRRPRVPKAAAAKASEGTRASGEVPTRPKPAACFPVVADHCIGAPFELASATGSRRCGSNTTPFSLNMTLTFGSDD